VWVIVIVRAHVRVRVSLVLAQMCVFVCVILQITGFLQGLAGLGTSSLCV